MSYAIQITAGQNGQIQVFQNGQDLGYWRGTKTIVAQNGDNISVWADADPGYVLKNICLPDGATCTNARPFNFQANMDVSMTATFQSTGAPPAGALTIAVDKTSINSGGAVNVSGTYHPNTLLNIFLEGAVRTHLGQVTTDEQGNYSAKVTITNPGAAQAAYKIGVCNVSSVPEWPYECAFLPDTAFVNVNVMPEGCWIREPVTGTCILTARTGTILAAVGAVALIGIIFLVTRPGTQRFVTELGREVARGATMAVV